MQFGNVAEHIYTSRYLSGLAGGGVQTTMMLYLSQIADDDIRGMLGTISQLTRCFGTLVAYVLGAYFNYIQMSIIFIGVTMVYVISFYRSPSTPQHLLNIGAINVRISHRTFDINWLIFRFRFFPARMLNWRSDIIKDSDPMNSARSYRKRLIDCK